jgi:hypothetical protein
MWWKIKKEYIKMHQNMVILDHTVGREIAVSFKCANLNHQK